MVMVMDVSTPYHPAITVPRVAVCQVPFPIPVMVVIVMVVMIIGRIFLGDFDTLGTLPPEVVGQQSRLRIRYWIEQIAVGICHGD